jgi:predicted Zn-dependent protease
MRAIAIVAAVWIAVAPVPADACINTVLKGQPAARTIKRAEALLRAGEHARVIMLLSQRRFSDEGLRGRADLLERTAEVRLLAADQERNPADMQDAADYLRELRDAAPDDPLIQARLAEALAFVPEAQAEARTLIEDLVTRDLMPEPEAWLTAARVRAAASDAEGVEAALESCVKIARGRKHICRLPAS